MLQLACLWLASNDENSNTVQLKSLQFAVCALLLVYSVHFSPGPQSAVHSLRFTLNDGKPSFGSLDHLA